MHRKATIAVVALTTSLAIGVGSSSAAPATPNGLCGASNMVNTNALPGMMNAMSLNDGNGDTGMYGAVANSSCAP